MYDELNLTVGEALQKRSDVNHSLPPPISHILTVDAGFPRNIYLFD